MKMNNRTRAAHGLIVGAMVLCLTLPAFSASVKEVADINITSHLNTQMWKDSALPANDIEVQTKDGIVTLEGTVDNIMTKDRAQALVEASVGVRGIVNMITVWPSKTRDDMELAQAVKDAWLADPAADTYDLSASATNGVVTLTGTVQSYAEKDLAERVARGVRGVTDIKNEITVAYETQRSDLEIENEIKARLENDIRVDDQLVVVKVKDGDVTLSGAVGSLQEKSQALSNTWVVAGVKSVNADGLDLNWWARDDMRRKSAYTSRTDEETRKAVQDAFLYDPRILSFNPEVEVSDGTVTLIGTVDNLEAKRSAEWVARNTMGVWRLKNQLKVRTEIPGNEDLEQRVATALLNDPYVERYDITVDAYNGWVNLSGKTNSAFEKNQAERVTEGVKGVVGVNNNLENDYSWAWKPDLEILEDVKEQLWWSPFVDSDEIVVSVDKGVVTLSGSADSLSERDDAEKSAFQGGAMNVTNDLVVDSRCYGPCGPGYYQVPYYNPRYLP